MLQATESWAGPGNEANVLYTSLQHVAFSHNPIDLKSKDMAWGQGLGIEPY